MKISPWPSFKVFTTWVIKCDLFGWTLVPSIKSVNEVAFEIWPIVNFFLRMFGKNWSWPWVIGTWVIECALSDYLLVQSIKFVGEVYTRYGQLLNFLPILEKIWPWPVTLIFNQSHRHLNHWMRHTSLYFGAKYKLCMRNSIRDIANWFVFDYFWTFNLDPWPWPKVFYLDN